jgi:hypothetical protein
MQSLNEIKPQIREEYLRVGVIMARAYSYWRDSINDPTSTLSEKFRRVLVWLPRTDRQYAMFLEGVGSPQGKVIQWHDGKSQVEFEIRELWTYLCNHYKDFHTMVNERIEISRKTTPATPKMVTLRDRFVEVNKRPPHTFGDSQALYTLSKELFPELSKLEHSRLAESVYEAEWSLVKNAA